MLYLLTYIDNGTLLFISIDFLLVSVVINQLCNKYRFLLYFSKYVYDSSNSIRQNPVFDQNCQDVRTK